MVNVFGLLLGSQAGWGKSARCQCLAFPVRNKQSLSIVMSCQQVVFVANGMATEQAQSSAVDAVALSFCFTQSSISDTDGSKDGNLAIVSASGLANSRYVSSCTLACAT